MTSKLPRVYDTDPPALAVTAALSAGLISPNEADSNGEPANVVDGLFAIARAIDGLATAISFGRPAPPADSETPF